RGGRPVHVRRPALPDHRPAGPRKGPRSVPRIRLRARRRLGHDARRDRPPLARASPAGLMFSRSADLYDAVYSFKDYAQEAERVHELVLERRPAASTLLDVACGTGRHLEQLRRWYDVTGIDLDPGLLTVARKRLPDVSLQEGDMRSFDLGRRFD